MKQKLDPELAVVSGRIYGSDPVRYARLIVWIKRQQKYHCSDESIKICLQLAEPYIARAPDWWAYLTKLMPKASARASEAANNRYKKSDPAESWKNLLSSFQKWVKESTLQ